MNKIDTVIYACGIAALVCIALYFIYLGILGIRKLVEWISPKIGRRCENCYWNNKFSNPRCARCTRDWRRKDMFYRKKKIKRGNGHRSNFAYVDEDAFLKYMNPPEERAPEPYMNPPEFDVEDACKRLTENMVKDGLIPKEITDPELYVENLEKRFNDAGILPMKLK